MLTDFDEILGTYIIYLNLQTVFLKSLLRAYKQKLKKTTSSIFFAVPTKCIFFQNDELHYFAN